MPVILPPPSNQSPFFTLIVNFSFRLLFFRFFVCKEFQIKLLLGMDVVVVPACVLISFLSAGNMWKFCSKKKPKAHTKCQKSTSLEATRKWLSELDKTLHWNDTWRVFVFLNIVWLSLTWPSRFLESLHDSETFFPCKFVEMQNIIYGKDMRKPHWG